MPRSVVALFLLLPMSALAQPAAEIEGHRLFTQSCAICHLKPNMFANRYGPALDHDTVAGKEEAIRGFIETGTERMPGFRFGLSPAAIDEIIAYLETVPPAPKDQAKDQAKDQGGPR